MLIGYARASEGADEGEQRAVLTSLGVVPHRIRIDSGLRGTRRELPNRTAMLAALAPGDIVAVTALERLARSAAELGEITREIVTRDAILRVGDTVYDPSTETGRTAFDLFTNLFPQFEAGIYELRLAGPREKAKAAGRYPGGKPKLTPSQRRKLYDLHEADMKTIGELQKMFGLSRSGVYMQIQHERQAQNRS